MEDIDFQLWDDIVAEKSEVLPFSPRPSVRAALAAIRQEQSVVTGAELDLDMPSLTEQDFDDLFGEDR